MKVGIPQGKSQVAMRSVLLAFSQVVLINIIGAIILGRLTEVLQKMGKRKVKNESNLHEMVLPATSDVLGMAVKMLGSERILVKCQDGKERLCRVRGKLKRRVWIREGDIVLVSPWDFQADKRGDIFWRYRKNQTEWLRGHGYLTM
jgi:translation initiation factor 1A